MSCCINDSRIPAAALALALFLPAGWALAENTEDLTLDEILQGESEDAAGAEAFELTSEEGAEGNPALQGNALRGKNPLSVMQFGDKPRQALVEADGKRIAQYDIDFLGFWTLTLGYTKRDRLYSITFGQGAGSLSVEESDARVAQLMKLCDEWCSGIKWETDRQDGRLSAVGKAKVYRPTIVDGFPVLPKYSDRKFSIMPVKGGDGSFGLQVDLVDNRLRRIDNDYLKFDVRQLYWIDERRSEEALRWLEDQYVAHRLSECRFDRIFDRRLNAYRYNMLLECGAEKAAADGASRRIGISLCNGVLENVCKAGKTRLQNPLSDGVAEKLITAKITSFNKEMEGVAGTISDARGSGGGVKLPCPECHGDRTMTSACGECWDKSRNRNAGQISIGKQDFKGRFGSYKNYYSTRTKPSGWHAKQPQGTFGQSHSPAAPRPAQTQPSPAASRQPARQQPATRPVGAPGRSGPPAGGMMGPRR